MKNGCLQPKCAGCFESAIFLTMFWHVVIIYFRYNLSVHFHLIDFTVPVPNVFQTQTVLFVYILKMYFKHNDKHTRVRACVFVRTTFTSRGWSSTSNGENFPKAKGDPHWPDYIAVLCSQLCCSCVHCARAYRGEQSSCSSVAPINSSLSWFPSKIGSGLDLKYSGKPRKPEYIHTDDPSYNCK